MLQEGRIYSGNAAPLEKNLAEYLRKRPECEVYIGARQKSDFGGGVGVPNSGVPPTLAEAQQHQLQLQLQQQKQLLQQQQLAQQQRLEQLRQQQQEELRKQLEQPMNVETSEEVGWTLDMLQRHHMLICNVSTRGVPSNDLIHPHFCA